MHNGNGEVTGDELLEFMSETLPMALDFLRKEGLSEADIVGRKARALVALSGERHLAKVVEKLGEAVSLVAGRQSEARPQLLALIQFLDKTLAEERQMAENLGRLFESLMEYPARQALPPPPEGPKPKRTALRFGQLPLLEGHPLCQNVSC